MSESHATRVKLTGNIGFIGAGNMAQAIGEGLVKSDVIHGSNIYVSAPSDRCFYTWNTIGAHTTHVNGIVVEKSDVIFLAVKPHMLDAVVNDLKKYDVQHFENKLFVSLLAGISLKTLEEKLEVVNPSARVIRVIPNTPMLVGAGCSVYCRGSKSTDDDVNKVKSILLQGGVCEEVPETIANCIGGLSGCGPAYVYLVIEALSDGAVKMGVPRTMATKFAAQTVLGAAKMVLDTGRHPGQLKDEVCSPGGTTITGIHALERGGVRCAMMDAVEAATKRAKEFDTK